MHVSDHPSEERSTEAAKGTSPADEFPKAYDPQLIEPRWAQAWVEQQLFRADPKTPGDRFSIVIPPPNVTGSIHIGHMLEHTQIDALTRWHRMRGFRTLWLPGMDHAGIATQVVVERELAKQNLKREADRPRGVRAARLGVESASPAAPSSGR